MIQYDLSNHFLTIFFTFFLFFLFLNRCTKVSSRIVFSLHIPKAISLWISSNIIYIILYRSTVVFRYSFDHSRINQVSRLDWLHYRQTTRFIILQCILARRVGRSLDEWIDTDFFRGSQNTACSTRLFTGVSFARRTLTGFSSSSRNTAGRSSACPWRLRGSRGWSTRK